MNYASSIRKHITTAGIIHAIGGSVYVGAIYIACTSGGGGSSQLEIRDRGAPMAIVPMHNVTPSSDGMPLTKDFTDKPVYMEGGIDIETTGTAEVDIWIVFADQNQ